MNTDNISEHIHTPNRIIKLTTKKIRYVHKYDKNTKSIK